MPTCCNEDTANNNNNDNNNNGDSLVKNVPVNEETKV